MRENTVVKANYMLDLMLTAYYQTMRMMIPEPSLVDSLKHCSLKGHMETLVFYSSEKHPCKYIINSDKFTKILTRGEGPMGHRCLFEGEVN